MKPLLKTKVFGESKNSETLGQGEANRTFGFCKHPSGRQTQNNAPVFSGADFAALAQFAEGAFASASALFVHIKKLQPNDPSLAEIGAVLKRANLSFGEFKARTQGCPTGVRP